jgi:hypothetical protein
MPHKGNKAMKADGWAVIECIGIDVRSVSPTRRAAIVNWLVTRGRWISTSTTDEQIEDYWSEDRGEAEVVQVTVQTAVQ